MISVIIPVYNHRNYLADAVLSATQSPLATEILLVDDGSTDGSAELMLAMQAVSPKVRVVEPPSGVNCGASARLNQLVDAAMNEWVAVLNSDDEFVSARFEIAERTIRKRAADLIFGDLLIIDHVGLVLGARNSIYHNEVPWPGDWDPRELVRSDAWTQLLAVQNIAATTSNMIFTKSIHNAVGRFRDFRYCHDWDFLLRCALLGKVTYLPQMLTKYRVHSQNTIKESQARVVNEVRSMLRGIHADFPALLNDRRYLTGLDHNRYFLDFGNPWLYVVDRTSSVEIALLERELAPYTLGVAFVDAVPAGTPGWAYVIDDPRAISALSLNGIYNLRLAAAVRGYDEFVVSRSAEPYPKIGDIGNRLVVRRVGNIESGAPPATVRYVRCYPPTSNARLADAPDRGQPTVDHAFAETSDPGRPNRGAGRVAFSIPHRASVIAEKPTVIVLPAFFAVGGVEKLIVDAMTQLEDRYRFVVCNLEPLQASQGSMHADALRFADVYDVAEDVRMADRLAALRMLRDAYHPEVVWIANGSPWQIAHAAEIRALFDGVAIVDNQAYDHEAGWIAHFDSAGVAEADRFVAINQRIRDVMTTRYQIPTERIDLIYHGADMSRIAAAPKTEARTAEARAKLGLPRDGIIVGMIGRLTAQKRAFDLLDLAVRSRGSGRNVHFLWVGMGPLEAALRQAVAAAGLDNFTVLTGITDPLPVYHALSALVITSEYEGLPMTLIEALSLGLPVLSTDVGAIREVLDRYGSGVVFSPAGDLDRLERSFVAFLDDLDRFDRLAREAAGRVQVDFSNRRMAEEYDASWRRAMDDVRGAGAVRTVNSQTGASAHSRGPLVTSSQRGVVTQ